MTEPAAAGWRRRRLGPGAFALRFLVLFMCMTAAFEASRGSTFEQALVEGFVVMPSAALINSVTPDEHVEARARALVTPESSLRVTRGCEGVESLLLLAAAIVAFPASIHRKVRGLAIGVVLAYVATLARLMALHYTLRHAPRAWEALHGFVLPLAPVALLGWYFLRWSQAAATSGPAGGARAE